MNFSPDCDPPQLSQTHFVFSIKLAQFQFYGDKEASVCLPVYLSILEILLDWFGKGCPDQNTENTTNAIECEAFLLIPQEPRELWTNRDDNRIQHIKWVQGDPSTEF